MVPVGQKFGEQLCQLVLTWSFSWGSTEISTEVLSPLKTWLWLEDPMVSHSHGWWVSAGCWQDDSVSLYVGFTRGCLSSLLLWWLLSPRMSISEMMYNPQCPIWPGLRSPALSPLPYFVVCPEQPWFSVRGNYTRAWVSVDKNHWRLFGRLPTTHSLHLECPHLNLRFAKFSPTFNTQFKASTVHEVCFHHSTTSSPIVTLTALTIYMAFIISYLVLKIYTYVFSFHWNLSIWRHALCCIVSIQ